jgi:hypothetical protein
MRVSWWRVSAAAVLAVGFAPVPVATAATGNSQQELMKTCNAEAKTQAPTGEAHKQFMSDCLSGKTTATSSAKGNSQQEKMKACNAAAKTQAPSGEAHKQFMSDCLKGSGTTH